MLDVLHDWNPWWGDESRIDEIKGRDREVYIDKLMGLVKSRHIISIVGIRRSGKTTLMYQMIHRLLGSVSPGNILYVNLDDERLVGTDNTLDNIYKEFRRMNQSDGRTYIFLDEVQSVSGWEKWLKRQYDLKVDCKFVISGSSSSLISSDYSTLLTVLTITI